MNLSWLKRMWTSNADWTIIARTELPDIEKLLTYGCTKLEFIQTKLTNPFYLNIVQAWIHYNRVYQPSTEEIISDTIWFSNWTKYATTVIRKWDDKGLRFIGDLYDQDTGIILPRQNLENTYGIRIHFLCYTSLIRCLPKAIRKGINITFLIKPIIPYTINQVLNDRKFPRLAYRAFVDRHGSYNEVSQTRLQTKWRTDVGDFAEGTTEKISQATTSTYLIYLHFRILNRIYATNKFLYNINVADNSMCSFCKQTTETIYHLFWQCPKTQIFIKEILSHLKEDYEVNINIDKANCFFSQRLLKHRSAASDTDERTHT